MNVSQSPASELIAACRLPVAWANASQWRILDTDFGSGLHFLTFWQLWREDVTRPQRLHVVALAPVAPVCAAVPRAASRGPPPLQDLASRLAEECHGLLPGLHRLAFDAGRVNLTLCIGEPPALLRALRRFDADTVVLGPGAASHGQADWRAGSAKSLARFARRGTRLVCRSATPALRQALAQVGFRLPPPAEADAPASGEFAPGWTPRRRAARDDSVAAPADCVVIGAGLAGAAVAAQLARRGWQVTVLDAAPRPAAGASGPPVALLAPHVSADDALLSQLTRAGVRSTWQELQQLLQSGRDWCASGVLERRGREDLRLPRGWSPDGANESCIATPDRCVAAGLPPGTPALWHARAGWVRPARLVDAWLATPGVRFVGNACVATLRRSGEDWQAVAPSGRVIAAGARAVLAAGFGSAALAPTLPLTPVRGQLVWGHSDAAALPAMPVNGAGHLIAHVPDGKRALWLAGASFERDDDDQAPRPEQVARQQAQLARLHPTAAAMLDGDFAQGRVQAWAGVRCAALDRRPLLGPLDAANAPGVWVCTAMGSRGLTFATLCAQLLAARWHGEPLPLSARMADALDTARLRGHPGGR